MIRQKHMMHIANLHVNRIWHKKLLYALLVVIRYSAKVRIPMLFRKARSMH